MAPKRHPTRRSQRLKKKGKTSATLDTYQVSTEVNVRPSRKHKRPLRLNSNEFFLPFKKRRSIIDSVWTERDCKSIAEPHGKNGNIHVPNDEEGDSNICRVGKEKVVNENSKGDNEKMENNEPADKGGDDAKSDVHDNYQDGRKVIKTCDKKKRGRRRKGCETKDNDNEDNRKSNEDKRKIDNTHESYRLESQDNRPCDNDEMKDEWSKVREVKNEGNKELLEEYEDEEEAVSDDERDDEDDFEDEGDEDNVSKNENEEDDIEDEGDKYKVSEDEGNEEDGFKDESGNGENEEQEFDGEGDEEEDLEDRRDKKDKSEDKGTEEEDSRDDGNEEEDSKDNGTEEE
ncbi:PREDICTED: uncharacterized protein DDB_G0283697-like [Priapulus caudatus]|uniref:Uncharacterized protein DDB_G0283697-like n=1 Tax=Priapulus caudatus TaxID=37621 RepID=A0ABM1F540_PRICU|nr:PREDICTED: uncharacterized protein DDB_G0283697-like [Priapulus caudatus]